MAHLLLELVHSIRLSRHEVVYRAHPWIFEVILGTPCVIIFLLHVHLSETRSPGGHGFRTVV